MRKAAIFPCTKLLFQAIKLSDLSEFNPELVNCFILDTNCIAVLVNFGYPELSFE